MPITCANREMTAVVDADELATAQALSDRAAALRNQAAAFDEVLATTYRRRAAELDLEAWVHTVRSGLPVDQIQLAAA
jgi:hypothetical protein